MKKSLLVVGLAVFGLLFIHADAQAEPLKSAAITVFGGETVEIPLENAVGGISLAAKDLGIDGIAEYIVGNGLGNAPLVRILRQDGSEIRSFEAYHEKMITGINLAVCDLDGDKEFEIITAPQRGGGPHIRVFTEAGILLTETFAYNPQFFGGVNLACGDLDKDGRDELATLPAVGGGSHVRIWKLRGSALDLHEEFFAFDHADRRGVVGTIHDGVLTIASQHASVTNVKSFLVRSPAQLVRDEAIELETNGIASVFFLNDQLHLSTTSGGYMYNVDTTDLTELAHPFGSVSGLNTDRDHDDIEELLLFPSRPIFGEDEGEKSIVIDLSDQRLYAYEHGVLAHSFLISSGRLPYRTPVGKHRILAKLPYVHYRWNYGEGNPNNYDLGRVPYNLRFYPHIYIHYAYWHDNFGNPMSHGCVNVDLENSKWIYEWSEEDIPVTVQE